MEKIATVEKEMLTLGEQGTSDRGDFSALRQTQGLAALCVHCTPELCWCPGVNNLNVLCWCTLRITRARSHCGLPLTPQFSLMIYCASNGQGVRSSVSAVRHVVCLHSNTEKGKYKSFLSWRRSGCHRTALLCLHLLSQQACRVCFPGKAQAAFLCCLFCSGSA